MRANERRLAAAHRECAFIQPGAVYWGICPTPRLANPQVAASGATAWDLL
jgi:hypothetical protein